MNLDDILDYDFLKGKFYHYMDMALTKVLEWKISLEDSSAYRQFMEYMYPNNNSSSTSDSIYKIISMKIHFKSGKYEMDTLIVEHDYPSKFLESGWTGIDQYIKEAEMDDSDSDSSPLLDVSYEMNGKRYKRNGEERKNRDYWVFGLYNVYARRNPFSIYFSQGTERPVSGSPIETFATQVSIVGSVIPAISYNFSF